MQKSGPTYGLSLACRTFTDAVEVDTRLNNTFYSIMNV